MYRLFTEERFLSSAVQMITETFEPNRETDRHDEIILLDHRFIA